jgi:hypothetical protein
MKPRERRVGRKNKINITTKAADTERAAVETDEIICVISSGEK